MTSSNSQLLLPSGETVKVHASFPAPDRPAGEHVDRLLSVATEYGASDIHLEPHPSGFAVRLRIDGVLQTIHEFPTSIQASITSRMKVMTMMDITEKRLPQDGQTKVVIGKDTISLRMSTLPGKYGEKIVVRLLGSAISSLDLGQMGMDPKTESLFEMLILKPQGMVLVTGPTGSGKSTTLYAAIKRLRDPLKNIITLEDPIEYDLLAGMDQAGVTQVQMNPKVGLTFATAMRASLRQDPDIIMVGEIRDRETAEVAMRAAMTGHLVFSTLHTTGAPETIGRLRDIGVDAYLIASTVRAVLAQRLVRVLCESCKEAYTLPARALKTLFTDASGSIKLHRPKGCPECRGTGYHGRKGIYELLNIDEEFREMIQTDVPVAELRKASVRKGILTLRQSALDLVSQGITSVEEVYRTTME